MGKLSPERMSKELRDIVVHRECVLRSGAYLAEELKRQGRGTYSTALLLRCETHDMSKLQNLDEFMSLATIVDDLGDMRDVSHVLSESQTNAISLHWENNRHHPEYFENPNDMSKLDIMEMVCDCHARGKQFGSKNVTAFFKANIGTRWMFDEQHQAWIYDYARILDELTKDNDYSDITSREYDLGFNFTDKTISLLEDFDTSPFNKYLDTERLYLRRVKETDFATVTYEIHLKDDNTEVGTIDLTYSGELFLKIYENYKGIGFGREALGKIMQISKSDAFYIYVLKENQAAIDSITSLGFVLDLSHVSDTSYKFIYYKPEKLKEEAQKTLGLRPKNK